MINLDNRWLTGLLLALVTGCGGPSTMGLATTPEEAKATVTTALDAWKNGTRQNDLALAKPPVYFQDDAFARGTPLSDYSIEGDGKVVGAGISFVVNLSLKGDGSKDNRSRKVAYRVVTRPNRAVTREENMP
ncbi:MAG: hypothetical protein EBS30_19055 [Planctomycetes bacterium]|nr:hypothetical protein [Planctomycetota bacterium]